jgi:hypothetical protein
MVLFIEFRLRKFLSNFYSTASTITISEQTRRPGTICRYQYGEQHSKLPFSHRHDEEGAEKAGIRVVDETVKAIIDSGKSNKAEVRMLPPMNRQASAARTNQFAIYREPPGPDGREDWHRTPRLPRDSSMWSAWIEQRIISPIAFSMIPLYPDDQTKQYAKASGEFHTSTSPFITVPMHRRRQT